MCKKVLSWFAAVLALMLVVGPAAADSIYSFSTGNPDGKIATLARPASAGKVETETADDFVTTAPTIITNFSFTGLLVGGATAANIANVQVELYHVFPVDSAPFDNRVVTRTNSPSDNAFDSRDAALGQLTFTTKLINRSFTAANSVVNGINTAPNQFTGGEGALTGVEVEIDGTFTTPFFLDADHFFFRPEVDLGNDGDFLWLSAPKPILPPGTPFPPGVTDLQSWIRNDALDPDWSRIGTDITQQGPFNAAFSLNGTIVPEPASLTLLGVALPVLALWGWRTNRLGRRRSGSSSA